MTPASRRWPWRLVTHAALGLLTGAGCALFLELRPADQSLNHKLSLALGYLGLAFLAFTLLVGPWNVLRARRNPVSLDLRRDVGIWAALTGLAHVIFGLQVHMKGKVWRYFFRREEGELVPLLSLFGLSNDAGAVAGLLLLVLLVLSNDLALRSLGSRRWKLVQRLNYACMILVAGHTWGYQVVERRSWPLVIGALAVILIVAAAQIRGSLRWRARRRQQPTGPASGSARGS